MRDIRLIALDLDETLLNSEKRLTPACERALRAASEAGIEIVPATGRFYRGMPDFIRALPYVRYAVTINGAEVLDVRENAAVYAANIPVDDAVRMMEYLDAQPVIYDCYLDGWGCMTRSMWERAAEFAPTEHNLKMIRELRTPVPDLKEHIRAVGHGVQKVQAFFHDLDLRSRVMEELTSLFPDAAVTTSISNNMEINAKDAQKGKALAGLASHLGIDLSQTVAFGDDFNDVTMLEAAGIGVAMGNAAEAVKAAADRVTESCDEDGVARELERMLNER